MSSSQQRRRNAVVGPGLQSEDRRVAEAFPSSTDVVEGNANLDQTRKQLPRGYIFLICFFAFLVWRWSFFFVWDDTGSASFNLYSNIGHYSLSHLATVFNDAFARIQGDGYRPLSAIERDLGDAYIYSSGLQVRPFLVINAAVFALAVLLFLTFARRYLEGVWWQSFAALLFFASTPSLTASLVLFSGNQFLVSIGILAVLETYLRYRETRRLRWLCLMGFFLVIGPWMREFVGVAGLLVLIHSALFGIRWEVIVTAFLGFLHALFPTLLASAVFRDLPIRFVLSIGNAGNSFALPAAQAGSVLSAIAGLHWRIILDVFSIFPPSAVLFAICVLVTSCLSLRWNRPDRNDAFLLIFFILTWAPFLKVFNEQVHLAYCAVPLSLLVARQFGRVAGSIPRTKALMILTVIVVVDQSINIWSVRQVTRHMYSEIESLANMFVKRFPPGTIVISNALHLEDIRLYSHGRIEPWGFPGGIPDQRKLITFADYEQLFRNRRDHQVLLLDAHLPESDGQRGATRFLAALSDPQLTVEDLGVVGSLHYRYPFIDPLRLLLPVEVATWPGPPDLEFDFYRGPALSGEPMLSEVALEYHLYRVTGFVPPPPQLLEEAFAGFNIVGYQGRVYAIPQPEGAFDLARIRQKGYSASFEGSTIDEVKRAVQAYRKAGR
jgi:hypothetical protein